MDRNTVLLMISQGKLTRGEAAAILQVSTRQVNRLMQALGIRRPVSKTAQKMADAERNRIERERKAQEIVALTQEIALRRVKPKEIAERFQCSLRTAYRIRDAALVRYQQAKQGQLDV